MQQEPEGTAAAPGKTYRLGGIVVREEDIESTKGLHVAVTVFRAAAVVILLLALGQFGAWWLDRPPGGVGVGLLIGDTIRLIVVASLLWAAGDLAVLLTQSHDDVRAARILLARQTYMMQQMGIKAGELAQPGADAGASRRADDEGGAVP